MMINPTKLGLKPSTPPSSPRHQDSSSSRDVARRKQFKPSRLGTPPRGEPHSTPSDSSDVGSTARSPPSPPPVHDHLPQSTGMRDNSIGSCGRTTAVVLKQEPIPIEERFRNQLMQPAVFCGGLTAGVALPTTSGHYNNTLPPLAGLHDKRPESFCNNGLQPNGDPLTGGTVVRSPLPAVYSRAVRSKSACVEGGSEEGSTPTRCNSLPPPSRSGPVVEQTQGVGLHSRSADSTGHSTPSAPRLISEKTGHSGNGIEGGTPVPSPLDLSVRGVDGGGRRKRKHSSRSSSRSSKMDRRPLIKAPRVENGACTLPFLPVLAHSINDPNSNGAMSSTSLMPQLPFMAAGDDRASVWTPQLAAAAASLLANGGRPVDGGRSTGAGRPEDELKESTSPQIMENISDDDWESMMEISNTDEAEKIRAIVGDNAPPVTDPNQCLVCRRILSCKSALQMHYRTHTGERPFKCRICQRAFTTKGNLKTHMGVHRSKVQHSTASVRVNPLLGAVRRTNHPPSPAVAHQCPICQQRFSSPPLLHQHIQQHTRNLTENGVHWDRPANRPLEPSTSLATSLNAAYLPFGLPFPAFNHPLPPFLHFPHLFTLPPMIAPAAPEMQLRRTPSPTASQHRRPQSSSKNGNFSVANLAASGLSSVSSSVRRDVEGDAVLNLSMPKRKRTGSSKPHSPSTASSLVEARRLPPTNACASLTVAHGIFSHQRPHPEGGDTQPIGRPTAATVAPGVKLPALPSFFTSLPQQLATSSVQAGVDAAAHLPQSLIALANAERPSSGRASSNGDDLSLSQAEKIARDSSPAVNPLDVMEKMCAEAVPEPSPRQPLPLSKHQCPICRKHFSSSSALQIHTRTHTGDKPFVCEVCKRAFTTRGNLKVHMGTHDIHQQPSRRGRRIFDAPYENGYPSAALEILNAGGGGNLPVTMASTSASNSLPPTPADAALMLGGGGALSIFNPLAQLCQNPLLATSLLLNAVKSGDRAEDVSRMGTLAAFLRMLPLNGHFKPSGTNQIGCDTEELDEQLH